MVFGKIIIFPYGVDNGVGTGAGQYEKYAKKYEYDCFIRIFEADNAGNQNLLQMDRMAKRERKKETTDITITKIWDDESDVYDNRPGNVYFNILDEEDNTIEEDVVLTASDAKEDDKNTWTKTITGLPAGKTYHITEKSIGGAYIEPDYDPDGVTVTNSLALTSVTVNKEWEDDNNRDGKRANATVTLYETIDGKTTASKDAKGKTRTATLGKGTNNKATAKFENLPTYRGEKLITYSVEETNCPTGYTKSQVTKIPNKTNQFKITNTHPPEKIEELIVTKVWDDVSNKENTRPEKITIALKKGNTTVETKELSGNGNIWTTKFEDLYKYENGKKINYTVEEIGVPESTDECAVSVTVDGSIEDGFTITNKFVPKTEYRVHKEWDDDDNRDGLRPESIKITLYADGEKVKTDGDGKTLINPQTITPDSDGNWIYYFTNLLKYNSKEEIIEYTVKEESVPNRYEVDIKSY